MQLLKNYTVKWYENHHSGTWGHVDPESGGVCRNQFDMKFLWIFKFDCIVKKCTIFHDFGMQLLKNDTVKW